MPLYFLRGDITKLHTDAVVNAANSALAPGGGVCGAIFAAAGYDRLDRACRAIGGCETGQAVLTDGFALPASYIIHTVGPVWHGGSHGEAQLLKSCYRSSLLLAEQHGCTSIAFPLISAGIYGYPKREALALAVEAICEFLDTHEMEVTLALFEHGTALVDAALLSQVQPFIDRRCAGAPNAQQPPEGMRADPGEAFEACLLRLMDERGLSAAAVCRRANLSRRQFTQLREGSLAPGKPAVLALAVALRLSLEDTCRLLASGGFALSQSCLTDVTAEYFIRSGRFDIFEINEVLFALGETQLGA
ncbi:RNase III inhibitor [Clostridiaceae bacterium]|nr:RNase III inhibitor [Clostridiaceae bacterium]